MLRVITAIGENTNPDLSRDDYLVITSSAACNVLCLTPILTREPTATRMENVVIVANVVSEVRLTRGIREGTRILPRYSLLPLWYTCKGRFPTRFTP